MALWLWTQRIVAPINTELWMLNSLKYLNPQSLTADLDVCRKQTFAGRGMIFYLQPLICKAHNIV